MIKHYMLKPIRSSQDAVDFMCHLYLDRLIWHFDDDPADFIDNATGNPAYTHDQVVLLRERQVELFIHLEDPFEIPLLLLKQSNNM